MVALQEFVKRYRHALSIAERASSGWTSSDVDPVRQGSSGHSGLGRGQEVGVASSDPEAAALPAGGGV